MWGVGIMYMIIGSLYFWGKKVDLKLNYASKRIYLSLFISGCTISILSILSFLLTHIIYMISCSLISCVMSLYSLNVFKNWILANETIDKLTND